MLVLSRRRCESLTVFLADGAEVVVTVVKVDGGRVKLGLTAPDDALVLRNELIPSGEGGRG